MSDEDTMKLVLLHLSDKNSPREYFLQIKRGDNRNIFLENDGRAMRGFIISQDNESDVIL
jgi:hypothetical protein